MVVDLLPGLLDAQIRETFYHKDHREHRGGINSFQNPGIFSVASVISVVKNHYLFRTTPNSVTKESLVTAREVYEEIIYETHAFIYLFYYDNAIAYGRSEGIGFCG